MKVSSTFFLHAMLVLLTLCISSCKGNSATISNPNNWPSWLQLPSGSTADRIQGLALFQSNSYTEVLEDSADGYVAAMGFQCNGTIADMERYFTPIVIKNMRETTPHFTQHNGDKLSVNYTISDSTESTFITVSYMDSHNYNSSGKNAFTIMISSGKKK